MEVNQYLKSWTLNEMNMSFSVIVLFDKKYGQELTLLVEETLKKITSYLKAMEHKFSPFKKAAVVRSLNWVA